MSHPGLTLAVADSVAARRGQEATPSSLSQRTQGAVMSLARPCETMRPAPLVPLGPGLQVGRTPRLLKNLKAELELIHQRPLPKRRRTVKWTICALRATEASAVSGAGLCPRCAVENCFRLRIPINLLSRPIGARRHHAGHRVRKSVVHGGVWLFSAAQAIQPIGHMRGVLIPNSHWRKRLVTGQQDVLDGTQAVNTSVFFVISLLFHQLPARTALASVIDHGGFLSHDPCESGGIIAEARRIAH